MTWKGESHRHKLARMGINTNPNTQSVDPVASKLFYLDKFDPPMLYDFIGDFPDSRYKTRLEYQQKEKDRTAKIVWMTPDEYETTLHFGFTNITENDIKERLDHDNLTQMIEHMKTNKMYMPFLKYDYYMLNDKPVATFTQEGHHRTISAKMLGAKEIPVFVIYPYSQKSFDIVAREMPNSLKQKLGK